MIVRLRKIGTGTNNDPQRADLPEYRTIIDEGDTIIALVPDDILPPNLSGIYTIVNFLNVFNPTLESLFRIKKHLEKNYPFREYNP